MVSTLGPRSHSSLEHKEYYLIWNREIKFLSTHRNDIHFHQSYFCLKQPKSNLLHFYKTCYYWFEEKNLLFISSFWYPFLFWTRGGNPQNKCSIETISIYLKGGHSQLLFSLFGNSISFSCSLSSTKWFRQ